MKFFFILFSFFLIFGCAEEKYLSPGGPGEDHRGQQKPIAKNCETKFSDKCLKLNWVTLSVPEKEFGEFYIRMFELQEPDNFPVLVDLDGDFHIELWMPSHGHGSTPVTLEKVDVGTYRASKVFFIMPGEWEIRFQKIETIKGRHTIVEQAVFPIYF